MKAYGQNETIKNELDFLNKAVIALQSETGPKLEGRLGGYSAVKDVYAKAGINQKLIYDLALKFIVSHEQKEKGDNLDESDKNIALQIAGIMKNDYSEINLEVGIMAILINTFDSPDLLQAKPFSLDQMEGPLKPVEETAGINWGKVLTIGGGVLAATFIVGYLIRNGLKKN